MEFTLNIHDVNFLHLPQVRWDDSLQTDAFPPLPTNRPMARDYHEKSRFRKSKAAFPKFNTYI
jgi:hypothetical protein